MSDGVSVTAGSGTTVATDDIGGVHYQRNKLVIGADGTAVDVQPPDADGKGATSIVSVEGMLYNGSTFDRQRGNTEGTLLASAARTATTGSATQTNHNAKGVICTINVTVAGTGNLTLTVFAIDPVAGPWSQLVASGAISTATYQTIVAYPGAVTSGGVTAASLPLPRTWFARVAHTDASSWTYSVSFSTIV